VPAAARPALWAHALVQAPRPSRLGGRGGGGGKRPRAGLRRGGRGDGDGGRPPGAGEENLFFFFSSSSIFPLFPPLHSLTRPPSLFFLSPPQKKTSTPLPKLIRARFLAGARAKLWWMTPVWGQRGSSLPPETQFLLVEVKPGGPYAAFVPLIDGSGSFRATLRPAR